MKQYKFKIKEVHYGEAIIKAESLQEAKQKFADGKEDDFEMFDDIPVDPVIVSVEVYNPFTDEYEELEA